MKFDVNVPTLKIIKTGTKKVTVDTACLSPAIQEPWTKKQMTTLCLLSLIIPFFGAIVATMQFIKDNKPRRGQAIVLEIISILVVFGILGVVLASMLNSALSGYDMYYCLYERICG